MGLIAAGNGRHLQSLIDGDPVSWTILAITFAVLFPFVLWRIRKRDRD
jgi:hypothetical protein